MKKLTRYLMIFLAVMTASCEKAPVDSTSTGIELVPPLGYISFRTDVATKTPIITSLKGQTFGVFGFSYSNTTDWGTARAVASPDIFQNMAVTCDENGVPSYDADAGIAGKQLTPWNLLKLYSFFAYYPYGNSNVVFNNELKTDLPIVTYTLPLDSSPVNPDNLVDLMTAHAIDHDPVKDAVVSFNEEYTEGAPVAKFQHRLFCIEVVSQNFNDNTNELIRNPKLVISNLKYKSISVPLQRGDSKFSPTMVERPAGDITFDITETTDAAITVHAQNDPAYTGPVSVSGTKNVMLIPQERLEGKVVFELYNSETGVWESKSQLFESKINFEEGKKYTLSVNFTGDAIVIVLSEAGSWEPFSVNYEFA